MDDNSDFSDSDELAALTGAMGSDSDLSLSYNCEHAPILAKTSDERAELKKKLLGYFLVFVGMLLMVIGLASTQLLNHTIPHSELNGLRFTAQIVINGLGLALFHRCDLTFPRELMGPMLLAGVAVTAVSYGIYGASYYIAIGYIISIESCLSIIISLIVACIIARSLQTNFCECMAGVMCVVGVVMVTQPHFIFGDRIPQGHHNVSTYVSPCQLDLEIITSQLQQANVTSNGTLYDLTRNISDDILGYTLCALFALSFVMYTLIIRHKLSELPVFTLSFWVSVVGVAISYLLMAFTETPTMPTHPMCLTFMFIHILAAAIYNICYSKAFQLINPVQGYMIMALAIPTSFCLQYAGIPGLLPGHQNPLEVSGAVVMFAGNIVVPMYEMARLHRLSREKPR